ncbi:alpha/beta hydrolase [Sandaracinus amylolyticus]|uniref:alpha/beta hydrolase n=1 Tax=Sandaracinus amylolyticus TaxID=927083 RepID=UPI001F36CB6C|nr:alpha/beta hydrolase [Sandaracinus amylolyticus]UJR86986.1 Hypothetical protein I5071_90870 [Sandaracinus amylolyticus]
MRTERVVFDVGSDSVVGLLCLPDRSGPHPAVVIDGPMTSIKEQASGNYARALAARGFVALALDHRYFGESGGQPRQYESPPKKIEDMHRALDVLAMRPEVDAARLAVVGVCAGAGYAASVAARDARVKAFGAVAGFFHDAAQQRAWMGEGYDRALDEAETARRRFEATGESITIPAVGREGPVAMPLAEAFEYYGTPRGAVPGYVNAFAVMSRADTLPYDAMSAAPQIRVPTLLVHSKRALAPALAEKFAAALGGPAKLEWVESQGQIDFYDDPARIEPACDRLAAYFAAMSPRASDDVSDCR